MSAPALRARTIRALAGPKGQGKPLLTAEEWEALRKICSPAPSSPPLAGERR